MTTMGIGKKKSWLPLSICRNKASLAIMNYEEDIRAAKLFTAI